MEFMAFIHAFHPRISCQKHGIREAMLSWTERIFRFSLRFETRPIKILQNLDVLNFTHITKISWKPAWKPAWNTIDHAVKRGRTRRINHQSVVGVDERSYRKRHKYITLVCDMEKNDVDYITFERRMKSLDEYYHTLTEKQISSITAISIDT